jgi:membrane protease YdiL (CAAX protease family)
MATGFVVAYHLSGRNLAMTITLHMINNFVSFIAIIMSSLNFDHLSDMPQQIL